MPSRLDEARRAREPSAPLHENKPWVTGEKLWRAAVAADMKLPIVFADARDTRRLVAWAWIASIEIRDGGTAYRITDPQPLRGRSQQDLILHATGEPIQPGFIRPYAICKTPDFVLDASMPERPSVRDVAALIESWFPHAPERRALLTTLTRSVRLAARATPARWGLTLRLDRRLLRLNVGAAEVLVLPADGEPFALVDTAEAAHAGEAVGEFALFGEGHYRSAPEASQASAPSAAWAGVYDALVAAHEKVIEHLARSKRRYMWSDSHSEATLDYLRLALNVALPSPAYVGADDAVGSAVTAETPGPVEALEGRSLRREHLRRERSRELVKEAKKLALKAPEGLSCRVCGFDFERVYGPRGRGFAEAHHTVPLAQYTIGGAETRVDDLVIVCANCHRMLHRGPMMTIEALRATLRATTAGATPGPSR